MQIPQEIGVGGMLLFVFGQLTLAMIHVDPNKYESRNGFEIMTTRQIPADLNSEATVVKMMS
jgi:hypothetical protein